MVKKITEAEAQFMIDWKNALEDISFSDVGSEYYNQFMKSELIRVRLWKKTFNEKTRWKARRSNSGKLTLKYVIEGIPY